MNRNSIMILAGVIIVVLNLLFCIDLTIENVDTQVIERGLK